MDDLRLRIAAVAALLVVLFAATLGPALAEDAEPRPPAAKDAPENAGLTLQDLDGMLARNQAAKWIGIVARVGSLVVGLGLLIAFYLKQDKIRGGLLPAPPKFEPPVLTRPPEAVNAILYAAAATIILPGVTGLLGIEIFGKANETTVSFIAMAAWTLPLAAWVVLRRDRLMPGAEGLVVASATEVEALEALVEPGDPASERPILKRGPLVDLGRGAWTFCVASVFEVPAFMASAAIITFLEGEVAPQPLIQQVIQSASLALPVTIFFFGVIIAPFTEEAIFRALLYPAIKRSLGGGRRGAIQSAVIVSLAFAAVHWNALSFLPLFLLALVLTWVYERTSSLATIVLAHAIHNFLALLPLLVLRA